MNNMFKQTKRAGKDDDDEFTVQPFFTTFVPRKGGVFKINLHGPIYSPDQFVIAVQAIEAAGEDDIVEISLQSPGGSLMAADYFIHAMRKCEGQIHITATGDCSSAATLILLEADSFDLSEHFSSTLHCGSLGSGGNYNEYKAQVAFYPQWMEKVARSGYAGFLSDDEIDDMLAGKDIILDAEAWCKRWEKRNEYMKAKIEASQEDYLKSLLKDIDAAEAEDTAVEEKPKKLRKPRAKKAAVEVPSE